MTAKRDLLSIADFSADELRHILRRARELKTQTASPLAGKNFALLFEKPSLRTRASFQIGIQQLGGFSLYFSQQEVGLGVREPVSDVARVLSGYADGIIVRVFLHKHLEELARYASIPVINALSDWEHPCQIVADLLTIQEHIGELEGRKLAFVGDGNNVSRSLALALPVLGMSFAIAAPGGYQLDAATLEQARKRATGGVRVEAVARPADAVKGADVVYTDTWISMGQEEESAARRQAFQGYTVDPALMAQARPGARFMHDMPAYYGHEVPPGMLERPESLAYPQAHNRLHAQKAILEFLLNGG